MSTTQAAQQLSWAWAQQRIWSQAASQLKERLDRARRTVLLLAITTAVLAVAAGQISGLSMPAGRILSASAAVTAGVATLLQRRVSTQQIRVWTRARSAAEGLKTEIYSYLAGGTAYTGADRNRRLGIETRNIVDAVSDLQRQTLKLKPDSKPLPSIRDIDTYIAMRLDDQIHNYYRKKAAIYETRIGRLRTVGDMLGVTAIILAALAAALEVDSLAAWVPVVTTIGTSLAAHIAAARYDHLVIEFLRTAQRLEHLRDQYTETPTNNASFIDACEAAISIENQGWMARWDDATKQNI
jgi:SMODS and SLOG-associating 2TM effector domain 1/Protein of unknown function (DUF4231)